MKYPKRRAKLIRMLDLGINFFDNANIFSGGAALLLRKKFSPKA